MPIVELGANVQIEVGADGASLALRSALSGVSQVEVQATGTLRKAPRVVAATAIAPGVVRVTFDTPMSRDSRLTNIANYSIATPAGAAPLFVSAVTPQDVANPTWVELATNEHTNLTTYTVEVESGAGGPRDAYGYVVSAAGDSATFAGAGVAPEIASVAAVGLNRVDVQFTEPMHDNAAIRDPSRYTFDGGLTVLSVLDVVGDTVKLVTSDQTPGQLYTLTIS
jgi:hypothetical protein